MASYDPRADTAKVANLTRERDAEKATHQKFAAALGHIPGISLKAAQRVLENAVQTVVTDCSA